MLYSIILMHNNQKKFQINGKCYWKIKLNFYFCSS